MKRSKSSRHWGRTILLIALLAIVCIGGVELAACRHFAPDTYERIVAPARYAAGVAADTGKAALDATGRFCHSVAVKTGELAVGAARFMAQQASELAARAAAAWKDFTTPPEPVILYVEPTPPPEESPPPQPPASDPPLTQVVESDGRRVLTGGVANTIYFCQTDEEWADQLFGTDPIGPYGCGPTAMAIVVASLTDEDTDPAQMAAWAADHGYWAYRSGSYHSIVQGTARAFGLEAAAVTERTADTLLDQLSSGHMMVALMG